MPAETTITIDTTGDAKAAWDAAIKRSGMKKKEFARRLVEWFVTQDEITQAIVLGQIQKQASEIAALILERTAAGKNPSGGRIAETEPKPTSGRFR